VIGQREPHSVLLALMCVIYTLQVHGSNLSYKVAMLPKFCAVPSEFYKDDMMLWHNLPMLSPTLLFVYSRITKQPANKRTAICHPFGDSGIMGYKQMTYCRLSLWHLFSGICFM
jgi:hypothetical protein